MHFEYIGGDPEEFLREQMGDEEYERHKLQQLAAQEQQEAAALSPMAMAQEYLMGVLTNAMCGYDNDRSVYLHTFCLSLMLWRSDPELFVELAAGWINEDYAPDYNVRRLRTALRILLGMPAYADN